MKGERGELRRPEGEGGGGQRERAAGEERGRAAERRLGRWPDGEQRGVVRGGRSGDLVRVGEIFLVLF